MKGGPLLVALAAAALVSCSRGTPRECHSAAGATVCLVDLHSDVYRSGGSYRPEATGLKPGSTLMWRLSGRDVPEGRGGLPSMTVDGNGRYPPRSGFEPGVFLAGIRHHVLITFDGTAASGAAFTVRFTR